MSRRCGSAGMLVSLGSPIVVDEAVSRRCVSVGCLVLLSFGSPVVVVEFFPLSFKFCVTHLQPWVWSDMSPRIHMLYIVLSLK
jgi:hypothetical protein